MEKKITEQDSLYDNLEQMPVQELLEHINDEDQKVAQAVRLALPMISAAVKQILERMESGGRLFYIGAGTSGRLGVLDASECPPTFGVDADKVIGLIAGGDTALRKAVEKAEDNREQGWLDLQAQNITEKDCLVGITAGGSTPYVLGACEKASKEQVLTVGITNNPNAELNSFVDFPIVAEVGPEFLTGSTRMKSGSSQKMILNMISTAVMVGLGRVKGNKMVDMQLNNKKLFNRGVLMVMEKGGVSFEEAAELLKAHKNVRKVLEIIASKQG